VFDADDSPNHGRYLTVASALRKLSLALPKAPHQNGTILNGATRVGVWVMPNNGDPGMLETFCLELAPGGHREYAEKVVAQAQKDGMTSFKSTYLPKATVHTYLAWQSQPGCALSHGIMSNALDREAELAKRFRGWVATLFA